MPNLLTVLEKQILSTVLCLGFVFLVIPGYGQNTTCTDSIQTILYSSGSFRFTNGLQDITSIITSDNGKLYFFNKFNNSSDSLVVFRMDSHGNPLWSKQLSEGTGTYFWIFSNIYELKNGNIIIAGGIGYVGNNTGTPLSCLLLLDKNGNLLWQYSYDDLGIENGNSNGNVAGQIAEGVNGEFVVTGFDNKLGLLVNRFDAGGNILSSNGYSLSSLMLSASPNGVYFVNNNIFIGGGFEGKRKWNLDAST